MSADQTAENPSHCIGTADGYPCLRRDRCAGRPCAYDDTLRCDVPGCAEEMCIRLNGEQRCYAHALERGNEIRAAHGLPPVTIDDDGGVHVRQ